MTLGTDRQLQERAEELLERHATPTADAAEAPRQRFRDRVVLRRGEARPSDLTAALDELGIGDGDDFAITRELHLDDPAEDRLGGFQRESETSRQAALTNYPRSGTQRYRMLMAVHQAGDRGVTSDELAERFDLRINSTMPRLNELRHGGWIDRTGGTRLSRTGAPADVYVMTRKGDEAIRANTPGGLDKAPGLILDSGRGK